MDPSAPFETVVGAAAIHGCCPAGGRMIQSPDSEHSQPPAELGDSGVNRTGSVFS
jgi:hypothetical protein